MDSKISYRYLPFKIRTISDQRFLLVWVLISFLVSIVLTAVIALWVYADYLKNFWPEPPSILGGGAIENQVPEPAAIPPWVVFGTDKLTFVLIGYDEVDEWAHRSDTLMVGAVDFYARKIRIVSIPRDTLVNIPGHGFNRINAAYALGGDDLARRTIEDFTGVKIDYIISVNYSGFIQIVDALGGVDLTIENAMHYEDRRGDTYIHIEAGDQHLDGEQALNYARFRHDRTGDFGRIERQQNMMTALFDQAIKPSNWTKLKRVADTLVENIGISANQEDPDEPVDAGIEHFLSILGFLTQLGNEDISFYLIETEDIRWNTWAVLRPVYSRTRGIFEEVFRDDDPVGWKIVGGLSRQGTYEKGQLDDGGHEED